MFRKKLEIREHAGAIYSLAFDGQFVYSASADHYVTRWNIETGIQDKFAIRFDKPVYTIHTEKDRLFAGCNNGDLHVFDLKSRKEIKFFTQHRAAVFSMCVNSEMNHFYAGDAEGNLSIWDIDTLKLLSFLPLGCGKIRDLGLSSSNEYILIAAANGQLISLESETLNEVDRFLAHNEACTSVLATNDYLITGGKDAYLRSWKSGGEKIKAIPAHLFAIYRLIRINELFISASRDKTIKVWSMKLDLIQRLDVKSGGHSHSVNDIVRISDHEFASCSDDRRIIIWEAN
jgi:WD40 repeat protein